MDICKNPGITQEQLSKVMYVHKSNVARQVGSLEEKGFVQRRPDPSDRRSLQLYPTEKALSVLGDIRCVHAKWRELLLDGMNEEEREIVAKCIERLAENAKRAVKKGEGEEQ